MKSILLFLCISVYITTTAQTLELVKNCNPSSSSDPSKFTVLGNKLYYFADDGTNGRELWQTDGTAANTKIAFNLVPGPVSLNALYLFEGMNKLYFTNNTPAAGDRFYVSDGTLANTISLGNFYVGCLHEYNNQVYFLETHFNFTNWELNLYKTDGTLPGTVFIMNVDNYSTQPNTDDFEMAVLDNKLYFTGTESTTGLNRLVVYDAATNLAQLVYQGPNPIFNMYNLTVHNNKLYMATDQENTGLGVELFQVDTANSVNIFNVDPSTNSYPRSFCSYGSKFYFVADNGSLLNHIYYIDGSNSMNSSIPFYSINSSYTGAQYLTAYKGSIFFAGVTDSSINLFKVDTITNTLTSVKVIYKGLGNRSDWVNKPFIYNGLLYFFASDTAYMFGASYVPDMQLWQSDGTTAGTKKCTFSNGMPDIYAFNNLAEVAPFNNSVFFAGGINASDMELVKLTATPLSMHNTGVPMQCKLYPNPFANTITIENAEQQITTIAISNIVGAVVAKQIIAQGKTVLALPNLQSGVYVASLLNKEGNMVATYKIVKQ